MGNQSSSANIAASSAKPTKKRPRDDDAVTQAEGHSRKTQTDSWSEAAPIRDNWPPEALTSAKDMYRSREVTPAQDDVPIARPTNPSSTGETTQRFEPMHRTNDLAPTTPSNFRRYLAEPAIAVAAVITPDRASGNTGNYVSQEALLVNGLPVEAATSPEKECCPRDVLPASDASRSVDPEDQNDVSSPEIEHGQRFSGAPPPCGPCGDRMMNFGKYCDRTYAEVYADDRDYCRWALRVRHPVSKLYDFVQYLEYHQKNDDVIGCDRRFKKCLRPTELLPVGNERMGFGKYCDQTYAGVYVNDRGYCRWALRVGYPGKKLHEFVQYLNCQNDAVIGCDPPMGFGKYRRRTHREVLTNNRGYCTWALRQHCPSGALRDFIQYLNDQKQDEAMKSSGSQ